MLMEYKRILTIQDISCIGQCSMTVALPILSACGHECCILPTAVLSTHTGGFGKPAVHHLREDLEGIWRHWHSQKITFDAILVGYLGSVQAIAAAEQIVDTMLAEKGICIVDPAMADHGKLYAGFDEAYVDAMRSLCAKADILLPNITEAAMLAGTAFRQDVDEDYVKELFSLLDGKTVVITGVGFSEGQTGAAVRGEEGMAYIHHPRVGKSYHGTGDIFAACFTGALMQGVPLAEAVRTAGEFTLRCIQNTEAAPAHWYGVKFETALPWLIEKLHRI